MTPPPRANAEAPVENKTEVVKEPESTKTDESQKASEATYTVTEISEMPGAVYLSGDGNTCTLLDEVDRVYISGEYQHFRLSPNEEDKERTDYVTNILNITAFEKNPFSGEDDYSDYYVFYILPKSIPAKNYVPQQNDNYYVDISKQSTILTTIEANNITFKPIMTGDLYCSYPTSKVTGKSIAEVNGVEVDPSLGPAQPGSIQDALKSDSIVHFYDWFISNKKTSITMGEYSGTDYEEFKIDVDIPCAIIATSVPGYEELNAEVQKTKNGYFTCDFSSIPDGRYQMQVGATVYWVNVTE